MPRLLSGLLLLSLLGALSLPFLLIDNTPAVATRLKLDAVQTARARALLREYDPRDLRDGEEKTLRISADELALVLTYLLHPFGGDAVEIDITPGRLLARAACRLPANPVGNWLNLKLTLTTPDDGPRSVALGLGHLTLPAALTGWLWEHAATLLESRTGVPAPGSLLREVTLAPAALSVRYEWQTRVANAVRQQLLPAEDQARLVDFHARLVALLATRRHAVPWPELAAPLFAYALERGEESDPVADNRAVLTVLVNYVTGRALTVLLPEAAHWPRPRRLPVRLHGREDLVQHFTVSALVAATGGRVLAETLGLGKEVDDSRVGSGFSFIDLLADESGKRFGEVATASPSAARALQKLASAAMDERDWMPSPAGLEENMPEAEFRRRYGGLEGVAYRQVRADIEQRLTTLPYGR